MTTNLDLIFKNPSLIDGTFTAELYDEDKDPNRVIDRGDSCTIVAKWEIHGKEAWLLSRPDAVWHLRAVAEGIGPVVEPIIASKDVPVKPFVMAWEEELVIPARSVPQDGAYKIVLLLTYTASNFHARVAGMVEFPMVQFYHHELPDTFEA